MKIIVPVLVLAVLTGCASVPDVKIVSKSGSFSVSSGSEICVVFPEDGKFEGKKYEESGIKVGEVIFKSVLNNYKAFQVASVQECTAAYLITSEILEYENRASGWSGKPDKIKVKVTLNNAENNKTNSFTYYAETNMIVSAFFEWGNAAPYKLLDGKFRDQVAALLQGK